MPYFKHETAIIDEGAVVGDNTRIWHWVHICGGACIGERCSLGQNVFVGSDVVIGSNVKVQNNAVLRHGNAGRGRVLRPQHGVHQRL